MLRWFRHEEDYAEVLQQIENDIKQTEEDMVSFVTRSSEWQAAILKYAGALYVAYLAAYFTVLSPVGDSAAAWLAKVAILTLVPVGIYYSRVLVDVWYKAKIRTNGNRLLQCWSCVEELKKKTGYYTTKNLLDKFDTPPKQLRPPTGTPKQQRGAAAVTPGGAIPGTPQNPMQTPTPGMTPQQSQLRQQQQGMTGTGETPFSTPSAMPSSSRPGNNNIPSIQVQGTPSAQSSWFDRVMDAVVGDTEGPQNKYALICQSCFEHNGLVPPESYHSIKFKCRTCNHLNAPHLYQYSTSMSRSGSTDSHLGDMVASSPSPRYRGLSGGGDAHNLNGGYVSDSGVSQQGGGGPGSGEYGHGGDGGGYDADDSRAASPMPPTASAADATYQQEGIEALGRVQDPSFDNDEGKQDLEHEPPSIPDDGNAGGRDGGDGGELERDSESSVEPFEIQGQQQQDKKTGKENVPNSGRQLRKRK
ncbi:hypothetical protein BDR26DRAFT_853986 [Obelidium mucronatum]|nr:hypothetical protein BDR26DRAFT_853986 [Obelidium mucronatum]